MPDWNKPWCYWLDETQVHPKRPGHFRVCIVFEHEAGYHPTGDAEKGQLPWYWTPEVCKQQNEEKLGLSEADTARIVARSMVLSSKKVRRAAGKRRV